MHVFSPKFHLSQCVLSHSSCQHGLGVHEQVVAERLNGVACRCWGAVPFAYLGAAAQPQGVGEVLVALLQRHPTPSTQRPAPTAHQPTWAMTSTQLMVAMQPPHLLHMTPMQAMQRMLNRRNLTCLATSR